MARTAKQIYDTLLLEQPIIFALASSSALRAVMDEYADEFETEENLPADVQDFLEVFNNRLDALLDLVVPDEF